MPPSAHRWRGQDRFVRTADSVDFVMESPTTRSQSNGPHPKRRDVFYCFGRADELLRLFNFF